MLEPRKAGLVSARELPKLVEEAIRVAGVKVTPAAIGSKWDLIGRELARGVDAQAFATAVTKQVNAAGVKAVPAVSIIDKKIFAGFYEKLAIPQFRQF